MVGLGATMGLFRVVHGAPNTCLMLGKGITFEGIWILEEPHSYNGGGMLGGAIHQMRKSFGQSLKIHIYF